MPELLRMRLPAVESRRSPYRSALPRDVGVTWRASPCDEPGHASAEVLDLPGLPRNASFWAPSPGWFAEQPVRNQLAPEPVPAFRLPGAHRTSEDQQSQALLTRGAHSCYTQPGSGKAL